MRQLTVHQPWAWAISRGLKLIENRDWPTSYRGPILIHAGKSRKSFGVAAEYFATLGIEMPPEDELVLGSAIAVAQLVDCVDFARLEGQPFAEGPYCWMLKDVRPITPLKVQGMLGLTKVHHEVIERIGSLDGSGQIGVAPSFPGW